MEIDRYLKESNEEAAAVPRPGRPDSPRKKSHRKPSNSRRAPLASPSDELFNSSVNAIVAPTTSPERRITRGGSKKTSASARSSSGAAALNQNAIKARMKQRNNNALDAAGSSHHVRTQRRQTLSTAQPQYNNIAAAPKSKSMQSDINTHIDRSNAFLPADASELLKSTHRKLGKTVADTRNKIADMQEKIAEMEAEIAGVQTEMDFL